MFRHTHPLWLVGFRPFFALACLAGLSLPLLWAMIFSGILPAPTAPFSSVQWHAHEMFFGFGWAVLGGFLLTSTKNWVNIRGYHGPALMVLAGAWIVERLAAGWGPDASWTQAGTRRHHEAHTLKLDCSKARTLLGWHPRWHADEAITRSLAWYQAWRSGADMYAYTLNEITAYNTP